MSNRKAPKPASLDRRCSPEAPSTAVSSSNGRFAGRRPAASTSLQKPGLWYVAAAAAAPAAAGGGGLRRAVLAVAS